MNVHLQDAPGTCPLHENRDFLRESEWIILKLLCRPVESLASADANVLSGASGNQLSPERCRQLINIVRISNLPGLGTWIARLLSEAGLDVKTLRTLSAKNIVRRVNTHAGYPICNQATMHAIADLQGSWAVK